MCVVSTALLDMPGCIIETLDPVSRIRRRATPSISTEMEGVTYSNIIKLKDAITAFSGSLRWRELSSLTPRSRFPASLFLSRALLLYERGLVAGGT